MARTTPERDWKYMKKIKEELLSTLCKRINRQASIILANSDATEHEKYLKLYKHIQDSDQTVGDCFNDWRRSTLFFKIFEIKRHGLLTPEQVQGLSAETREKLTALEQQL